jgi:hypothetical protein
MSLILDGSTGVSDVDGSAATPAIRGTDANTGMFFPAADTIAFSEGGVESMRIDSAGNLGVGTSSPNAASRATILSSGTSTSAFGNVALRLSSNGSGYASTLVFSDEVANSAGISMVSGSLAFGAGGFTSERMRIDSAGNVGIGTSSPASRLDINMPASTNGGVTVGVNSAMVGTLGSGGFAVNGGAMTDFGIRANANLLFSTGSGAPERMRIDSVGDVGIGTSNPLTLLHVRSNPNGGTDSSNCVAQFTLGDSSTYGDGILFVKNAGNRGSRGNGDGSPLLNLSFNNAVGLIFDRNGRMLFNSPSFTEGIISIKGFAGSSGMSIGVLNNGDNAVNFYNASNTYISSIVVNSGTVAYNTSSDYRLKENIAPMTGALATVAQLNPVTWNWKADGESGQGFIAHELQAIVPNAVTGEKDAVDADGNPKYQGVDTSFLVATLTAAIQELKAEFDAYKTTHP